MMEDLMQRESSSCAVTDFKDPLGVKDPLSLALEEEEDAFSLPVSNLMFSCLCYAPSIGYHMYHGLVQRLCHGHGLFSSACQQSVCVAGIVNTWLASSYSSPCDLRPLYLTVPSFLRLAISDTTDIFNINIPPF